MLWFHAQRRSGYVWMNIGVRSDDDAQSVSGSGHRCCELPISDDRDDQRPRVGLSIIKTRPGNESRSVHRVEIEDLRATWRPRRIRASPAERAMS